LELGVGLCGDFLWPFSSEGLSRLLGLKQALAIMLAKVVSMSMADGESVERFLEGSAMSREHPMSG
jgi:hypothetical protein